MRLAQRAAGSMARRTVVAFAFAPLAMRVVRLLARFRVAAERERAEESGGEHLVGVAGTVGRRSATATRPQGNLVRDRADDSQNVIRRASAALDSLPGHAFTEDDSRLIDAGTVLEPDRAAREVQAHRDFAVRPGDVHRPGVEAVLKLHSQL